MQSNGYEHVPADEDNDDRTPLANVDAFSDRTLLSGPSSNEGHQTSQTLQQTKNTEGDEADLDKKSSLRPHMYYDEGPFDAPSSDSEEEDTLLEKMSMRDETVRPVRRDEEDGFSPTNGLMLGGSKVRH